MMTPKEMEREIINIRNMVSDIHALVMTAGVSKEAFNWPVFDAVLKEFVKGNDKPLDRYIRRGGRIPSATERAAHDCG